MIVNRSGDPTEHEITLPQMRKPDRVEKEGPGILTCKDLILSVRTKTTDIEGERSHECGTLGRLYRRLLRLLER